MEQVLGDKKIKKIITVLCFSVFSLAAFAQDSPYANPEFQEVLKHDAYEPNYFTLIFGLVFVIFLIYLTGFFYQKLLGVNSKFNKKTLDLPDVNKVKILSCTSLGQGKNIYVVQINSKTLVLGATQNQINLLREFSEQETESYLKEIELFEENTNG